MMQSVDRMLRFGEFAPEELAFAPKVAVMSLYSGQVSRGVESWASSFCTALARAGAETTLLQGGPAPQSPSGTHRIVSVGGAAEDRSGDRRLLHKLLRRAYCTRADRDVYRFYIRCVEWLREHPVDFLFPCHYRLPFLRFLLRRGLTGIEVIGVSHGGVPKNWSDYDGFVGLTVRDGDRLGGGSDTVAVIPNGVDRERFGSAARDDASWRDDLISLLQEFGPQGAELPRELSRPVVLVVSALVPYKRVDRAIEAFSRLSSGTLLIAGDGPGRIEVENRLEALSKSNSALHGVLLREVPRQRMPQLYRGCDVATHPAGEEEVFGLAIIEAMASGLPVLVNDDPVRRSLVGIPELVIDPEQTVRYSNRLREVYEDRNRLGGLCRERAAEFCWDRVAKSYLEFLSRLKNLRGPES